jgi:uracil-DNA glycosylase family protein
MRTPASPGYKIASNMAAMSQVITTNEYIPDKASLPILRKAVQQCRGCDLYRAATQAVFGEGPAQARLMLVGEQPGNDEDLQGHPFVGPAGKLLDRALEEAGIARSEVYVTNAVKHFKFEDRGKRRLHKKPRASETKACRPWLEAEAARVQPEIIVCLGATAAQSILGKAFRLTKERRKFIEHPWARRVTATIHPSAILRAPDEEQRHLAYRSLVADLARVRGELKPSK